MGKKKKLLMVSVVMVLAVGVGAWLLLRKVMLSPPPRVTVGVETTLLTEPLLADGTVDFPAAINRKLGEGVTAENNAVVGLLAVVGSGKDILGPSHEEIVRLLGARETVGCWKPLPVDEKLDREQTHERETILERLETTAWKAGEHPDVDKWLKDNERAMELATKAVAQPQFWVPLALADKEGSLTSTIKGAWGFNRDLREIGRAFRMRAMRNVGAGTNEEAWKDVMAAHRLAHLMVQSGDLTTVLAGVNTERFALQSDVALLGARGIDPVLMQRMQVELEGLAPFPTIYEVMRREEIYWYPDAVQGMARSGQQLWDKTMAGKEHRGYEKYLQNAMSQPPDWDRVLRAGNVFFRDWYADRKGTEVERKAFTDDLQRRLEVMMERIKLDEGKSAEEYSRPKRWESANIFSDRLAAHLVCMLVPALGNGEASMARERKALELTILAVAVQRHRLEYGGYPADVSVLVPKYMAKVPLDFFDKPVKYKVTAEGFAIHSDGPWGDDPKAVKGRPQMLIDIEVKWR